MKQLTLLVLLCILVSSIIAQTNTFPADGNVGIGTTTPGCKLQIVVPGNAVGLNINGNNGSFTGADLVITRNNALGGAGQSPMIQFQDNTSGSVLIQGSGSNGIQFFNAINSSWVESMRIAPSGNIGIGISNPAAKLNIVTPANGTISTIKIGQAGDAGNTNVPLGAAAGGYNIDFAAWRDIAPDFVGARIRAERINTWQQNNALVQAMDLAFLTGEPGGALTEQLRIKYNGNIGIGITNPTTKLAVNGTITTKEVNVTTTGWPDYVFTPEHKLPSLESLAKQIKAEGHLPNIPSAEEVSKNGVALGEMNKKLLEKVEELTLYLIEMKKENDQQKKELQALKKEVTALKQTSNKK